MGRPAKPTHLKVLHGDDKKNPQRVNRAEPQPDDGPVEPPYELTKEVQEVWDEQAPDRIAKGVLTQWDVWAFAFWCEAVVMTRQGFVRARNDKPKQGAPSPTSMAKDGLSMAQTLGSRFGWTPSDRSKLIVGEQESSDGLEAKHLTG